MNNSLVIKDNMLVVEPRRMDKVWSFKNRLRIPLEHIVKAEVDPEIIDTKKGVKAPGLGTPDKWAGTWTLEGEKSFWNVTRDATPLVIHLQNEKFTRLILGVENASDWVETLNKAIEAD